VPPRLAPRLAGEALATSGEAGEAGLARPLRLFWGVLGQGSLSSKFSRPEAGTLSRAWSEGGRARWEEL
jgi:hypothetical protein